MLSKATEEEEEEEKKEAKKKLTRYSNRKRMLFRFSFPKIKQISGEKNRNYHTTCTVNKKLQPFARYNVTLIDILSATHQFFVWLSWQFTCYTCIIKFIHLSQVVQYRRCAKQLNCLILSNILNIDLIFKSSNSHNFTSQCMVKNNIAKYLK